MTAKNLTKEQKTALGKMMIEGFRANDLSVVEGCLRQGADLSHSFDWYNSNGSYYGNKPLLHWTAYFSKDKKILAAVIAAATDIDVRSSNGNNVLFAAVETSNAVAAAAFTAAGADVLAQNKEGQVALEQARKISDSASRKAVVEAMLADYSAQAGQKPAKAEEKLVAPPPAPPPNNNKKNPGNTFYL
jgi:ankyrin repeat protein